MTKEIRSPIPGVFYRRPSPEADPFVEIGSAVEPDTVVGLVEVMKTFHNLTADVAGSVASIDVEDNAMVDPGQLLMTIEETGGTTE